jgi:NitT/TauT family transport system substrate-binding protein
VTPARQAQLGAILTMLAAMLVSCGRGAAKAVPDGPRKKLKVAIQPFLTQAPLLLAQADSFFAREGLDVEFVKLASSTEGVAPLISGDLDVLPASANPALLNAMARGLAVRMVADRGYLDAKACTSVSIAVPPGRAAALRKNPRLVKRVSIERQHAMLYIIEKSFASVGLTLDSLDTRVIPPLPEAEALGKGTLDAAFVGEPWIARDVSAGKAEVWIRAEQVLPNLQSGFIFFGPNLLTRDRETGRKFIVAYRRAIRKFLEGKTAENVALLAKETGDTPELVRQSCWTPLHPDGRIDLATVQDYQTWLKDKGLVPVAATPAQMWDSTFVVYADSVLGRPHPSGGRS